MEKNSKIAYRYLSVLDQIRIAANSVGRTAEDITLVVITKGHSVEKIGQLIDIGCKNIGESYVQEALQKQITLRNRDVQWHMVGHVQSRKAKSVANNFEYLHSLDTLRLASKLNSGLNDTQWMLKVFLEINIGGESSKTGFPIRTEENHKDLVRMFEQCLDLLNIEPIGLMAIPPHSTDPEISRPYFKELVKIGHSLETQLSLAAPLKYSMGMSNDFQIAIEEGATHIRVGTAIMGQRTN